MPSQMRHRYFVHKHLQRALVVRMMSHIIAFAAASFAVTVFLEIVRDPFRDPGQWRQMFTTAVIAFSATTLCLLPILAWDSIKFSHRFVGPILRLKTELGKVGREATPAIQLRSSDYWHELAEEFNLMVERLPRLEEATSPSDATLDARNISAATSLVTDNKTPETLPPVAAV